MNGEDPITQFKKMAEADPDNEMAHFSLAKAYFDKGLFAECEPVFTRVLELNPTHSKSHQLLGNALVELGRRDDAAKLLKRGYEIAAERGDVMPRDGCAKLLTQLGEPVPEVAAAATSQPAPTGAATGAFRCTRCGRPGNRLPNRPFKGELGEKILARICTDCWREWVGMGTKVINELGLPLADPRAQDVYDDNLKDFLQLHE